MLRGLASRIFVLLKKLKKSPFMGFGSEWRFMVTLMPRMMSPVLWMVT